MRWLSGLTLVGALATGCGGSSSPAADPPIERILGGERLGWGQQASTAEEASALRFVIYVDSMPSDMTDVTCGTTAGRRGFACSGRLPTMLPGRPSLQIAATSPDGANRSALSEPLSVVVVSGATSSVAPRVPGRSRVAGVTTVDRVRLRIETVVDGLVDPTDVASLPDGRTLVAERAGAIRVVQGDRLLLSEAAPILNDVDGRGRGGLLALASDPSFDRNRFVYVAYTSTAGFRLARFREVGGAFVDRVILLDGIPSLRLDPAAVLRFGPDDKLYLGLDDGGDARRAGDLGSFNGKVLRFNADATTPADQAGGTPVYVLDVNAPRGLDWRSADGPLWIAQTSGEAAQPGELRGILREAPVRAGERRGRVAIRYLLPERVDVAQIAFYRGSLIQAFRGDLLVAAGEGGLLRVRFDTSDPLKVVSTERLFDGGTASVRAVSIGRDGAIYLSTATALLRVVPETMAP